jgi:ABC-type bacteriocin/lantibiotic exporter with double-glycine peptidase domain
MLDSERSEQDPPRSDVAYYRFEESSEPVPKLCLRTVTFGYETLKDDLLNNISLELSFGRTFGLVGASGSGKSTLIELLAGLYPPDRGEIVFRSRETAKWAQPMVALVSQEPFLFSASIKDNIQIVEHARSVDEDELMKCLGVVELDDFINSLPDKVDTRVGAGGVAVSGGQAQRLMIARALMLRPSVLLFDEATSAIDEEQEMRIVQRIRRDLPHSLLILVSHRTSSLSLCDQVITLSNGTVAASNSSCVSRKPSDNENMSTASDGSD